jgi:hypothetical protein
MTQGLVAVIINGETHYKIITGHDGMHAHAMAEAIKDSIYNGHLPTVTEIFELSGETGFGHQDDICILEAVDNPGDYTERCKLYYGAKMDFDEESERRYKKTFRCAQFNPRWDYGTADYVETVDVIVLWKERLIGGPQLDPDISEPPVTT